MSLRHEAGGGVRVDVEDDGVGLPPIRRKGGIGLQLMEASADRLNGLVQVGTGRAGGTRVGLSFPNRGASTNPMATAG